MIVVKSKNNIPVRLTNERWEHIIKRHPEMEGQKERVLQTVKGPQLIQKGDFGELIAIRYYRTTPLTSKYLVVVYKEVGNLDGFVITSYLSNKPYERRQVLWRK
jgi:hypothetical protein